MQVWAPHARQVELLVAGERVGLDPGVDGWYGHDVEPAHGTDYAFALDGSEPLPDPRSRWQPDGVFGPSRAFDPHAFAWSDDRWHGVPLAGSVVYELHLGTFSAAGTLDGAIGHLDHLVELGVDLIELMPVNAYDGGRGWGYDGVLLYAVHEPYGGPVALQRFVDAAHARGLGVILDVVYNHFGPTGNHLSRFGPYTTSRHHTPWGDALDLDGPSSRAVRSFVLDNACQWLRDFHVDGLRLDAAHALVDESERHVLAELAESVDALATALHRPLFLVAEYPRTEPLAVTARESGGHGLTAVWRDEVHHALHAVLTGERDGYYAEYGSLRDVASAFGGPKEDVPRHRFVVCTQNHDQVGNRARGERLAHLVGPSDAAIAAALVLCGPFTPLLFMGEEWAASSPFPYFAGPRDPELDEAVRRGRVDEFTAFGWDGATVPDPVDEATLAQARLPWCEVDHGEHAAMLDWYRRLLRLRREHSELSDPRPESASLDVDEARRLLVLRRGGLAVHANLGNGDVVVEADATEVLLASSPRVDLEDGQLVLPPHSLAVIR